MGLIEWLLGEEPGIITKALNYENKGQYGEYLTDYALNHDNVAGYLKTVKNVYVPYRGATTEIDVLMVHEKGIFVFESKNYSGWIFGSADAQMWTQSLPNREKHQFYNPIKQNASHIAALGDFLSLPQSAFTSYIIFSERCELKNVPKDTADYIILRRNNLLRNLRNLLKEREPRFTSTQVDEIAEKLKAAADVSSEDKQQHIAAIKEKTEGNICPFCGSENVQMARGIPFGLEAAYGNVLRNRLASSGGYEIYLGE